MTQIVNINKVQTITSLEIAELTGKQHKHVMEAIRRMEPAWVNMAGSNFRLGKKYMGANLR
jgi:phage regulator Rha-like protein